MKHLLSISLLFISLLIVVSCGKKKETDEGPTIGELADLRMDYSMERTGADSSQVVKMTTEYLDLLKKGDIDNAINKLVEFKNGKSVPLSHARKKEILAIIKNFPVLSFKIDTILMYSDSDTEVRYTTTFFEKTDSTDGRPNTIQGMINHRRIDGKWYMTIQERTHEDNFKDD